MLLGLLLSIAVIFYFINGYQEIRVEPFRNRKEDYWDEDRHDEYDFNDDDSN